MFVGPTSVRNTADPHVRCRASVTSLVRRARRCRGIFAFERFLEIDTKSGLWQKYAKMHSSMNKYAKNIKCNGPTGILEFRKESDTVRGWAHTVTPALMHAGAASWCNTTASRRVVPNVSRMCARRTSKALQRSTEVVPNRHAGGTTMSNVESTPPKKYASTAWIIIMGRTLYCRFLYACQRVSFLRYRL